MVTQKGIESTHLFLYNRIGFFYNQFEGSFLPLLGALGSARGNTAERNKMRIQEKCIPCTIQQAIKVAGMVGLKENDELLRKVFAEGEAGNR